MFLEIAVVPHAEIHREFEALYLTNVTPGELLSVKVASDSEREFPATVEARIRWDGDEKVIAAEGNGPINAFISALKAETGLSFHLTSYEEHAIEAGSDLVRVGSAIFGPRR